MPPGGIKSAVKSHFYERQNLNLVSQGRSLPGIVHRCRGKANMAPAKYYYSIQVLCLSTACLRFPVPARFPRECCWICDPRSLSGWGKWTGVKEGARGTAYTVKEHERGKERDPRLNQNPIFCTDLTHNYILRIANGLLKFGVTCRCT